MDFDREYDLENAGIDAFEFSLMDEDERRDALNDAGLDPDTYVDADLDFSFDAWSNLQTAGLSLSELEFMDDDERREALADVGLDPDDYEDAPSYQRYLFTSPASTYPQATQTPQPTPAPRTPPPPQNAAAYYRYCSVRFSGSERQYAYRCEDQSIKINEYVIVPTGPDNKESVAQVTAVGIYTAGVAPYPVEHTKFIIRKATTAEVGAVLTATVARVAEQESKRSAAPQTHVSPQPSPVTPQPVQSHTEQKTPPRRRNISVGWIFAAVAVIVLIIVAALPTSSNSKSRSSSYSYTPSRSTGSTYSYSRSTSTTPTCPPVNREPAMTKEEAERLRGTGYHNTRPNSSAENIELTAAQVKCKNCGYRSHNGVNSLCDYCAWMERYGGGLPASTQSTPKPVATPRPTTKPTPSPSTNPSSDPYNASDYAHPDDFYYDYYDDFWDYEDAEDYWEAHN